MKILGIDPGLQGALATWDGRVLKVVDVPIVKARARGNDVNVPSLVDSLRELSEPPLSAAYIERNSVRPREGIASAHKNGLTAGILLGCTAVFCSHIIRPTPQQWKKSMRLTSDKQYSITRAIETFPDYHHFFARKKDHGRAEAALLAYYGFLCEAGVKRKRLSHVQRRF